MSLSNDLISQFIKVTNDNTGKKEKTKTYATVVESGGVMYVQLDGSELITPVDTTNILHEGDRVIVDINEHNAVASGNISNPAVSGVELSQTEDTLRIEFQEGLENLELYFKDENAKLELKFKNGYEYGITRINKDGVKVTQSNYGGWTHMNAKGFYVNDGTKDVLKCTVDGLVYTGTITASDIMSTDGKFKIDKNGNITGASLKSSKGDNFSIDENGIITASGLAVEGNISTNTIICKEISNKAYPKTLTGTVNLWVDRTNGDDDSECLNNATFRTMQAAINSIPKHLNGKTVNIYLSRDYVGNASFSYFSGGRIYIFLGSHKFNGNMNFYHISASMYVYGGENTSAPTTKGIIHPSVGLNSASRTASIAIKQCKGVSLYYLEIWAADNQADGLTGHKVAISSQGGGYTYCSDIAPINCDICLRANSGVQAHINRSRGVCNVYGFQVLTGAQISFANSEQCGGKTAATNKASAGQIWYDSATFMTSGDSTGTGTAPTTQTKTTKTYTASSAQALQYAGTSSAFWRTDCKPKAGDWGYGAHTGWWFFGDDFEDMASKNVSKIEITFTREKAGNYAATACNFYVHSYETQPSTKTPTYNIGRIASASVAASTTHTISITDATIISRIKSAKGICTVPASQNSTNYSVFSGTMKVKFTYTS